MRLTYKNEEKYEPRAYNIGEQIINKLGQLEDIEDKLSIDLITFLKGIDTDKCFMQITEDKKFYLSKEGLLEFIQELLFMYWSLTKEKLE